MMTKGHSKLIKRLGRIKQTPVVTEWIVAAAEGKLAKDIPADTDRVLEALHAEGSHVAEMRRRLEGLPPSWRLEATLL